MTVRVQEAAFDVGAELNGFTEAMRGSGAVVSFTGITRDVAQGDMIAMEIEHYPGMTQTALEGIRAEAMERFELDGALVIHRFGRLLPGEVIMMVATASRHRAGAFLGAEFLMDYLKSRAPFWKREITGSGADWVAAKADDEAALKRW